MIAKTMSFLQNDKAVLILTEGTARVDNRKYKDTFHIKAKMIPFDEVENIIGHAPGGVCPFGINEGIEVYLDESLKQFTTVYERIGFTRLGVIPQGFRMPDDIMDKYKELVFSSLIFIFFEIVNIKGGKLMKTVKTPAGIFTINKVKIPSAYTCAAEQKIEYISENHMQITTMDQAVLFGNQLLSPRICQSCMNPDKITIYPLEIEYIGEKVLFTDHYSVKEWKKSDPLPEIHEWYPHIKKARCNPCRNCGRC